MEKGFAAMNEVKIIDNKLDKIKPIHYFLNREEPKKPNGV